MVAANFHCWPEKDIFLTHMKPLTASLNLTVMTLSASKPPLASHHQTQSTLFVEDLEQLSGIKLRLGALFFKS